MRNLPLTFDCMYTIVKSKVKILQNFVVFSEYMNFMYVHCKFLNARFESNDIVIFIYSHYHLDLNAKSSDTKCLTLNENYNVIALKSCIEIFTV